MAFVVSDEVQRKQDGQRMVVTAIHSGIIECHWHDGYSVRREAFRADELEPFTFVEGQLAS